LDRQRTGNTQQDAYQQAIQQAYGQQMGQQEYLNQLKGQQFQDAYAKAGGEAQQLGNIGTMKQHQADQTQAMWSGIGKGIGQGFGAAGAGGGGA
jgi:DNA-binding protein Fis